MNRSIVHVTSVHTATDVRIFWKIARSSAAAGAPTTIVAPRYFSSEKEEETIDGVKILRIIRRATGRTARIRYTAPAIIAAAAKLQADVYQLHDPELLYWVPQLRRAAPKARIVYDAHEDLREQLLTKHWIPAPLRRPTSLAVGFLEDRFIRRLDAVVAATEPIAQRFRHARPTCVVRNYPRREEMQALAKIERSPQHGALLYQGALSAARGILTLAKAVATLGDDTELWLAGPWDSTQFREEVLSESPRVRDLGTLNRTALSETMSRASVGLVTLHPFPSYRVSNPTKLYEYMAAGLPIVASDFPAWRTWLEPIGCAIFVDPTDPQRVAAALQELISDPKRAEAMGARGRAATEQNFHWETEWKTLETMYATLV